MFIAPPTELSVASALAKPTGRVDDDGRFIVELRALAADVFDRPSLLITAPGHASVCNQVFQSTDLGDIVLAPGFTQKGRVLDDKGRAIVGASIQAKDAWSRLLPFQGVKPTARLAFAAATSDAEGHFVLEGLPSGGMRVDVVAPGYFERSLPWHPSDQPLVITLDSGGFVEGQVRRSDGQPWATTIWLWSEFQEQGRRVQCDTKGEFRINLPDAARYRLQAQPLGGRMTFGEGVRSEVLQGPQRNVRLVAQGADRHIELEVTEAESGKAVELVRVGVCWHRPGASDLFVEPGLVPMRMPGTFRLPGPPPMQDDLVGTVSVGAPGLATTIVDDVAWREDPPVRLRVALRPQAVIEGVVVDEATGKPARHATVRVVLASRAQESSIFGFHDLRENHAVDAAGRFRIIGLAAEEYELRALHMGRPAGEPVLVKVSAAETKSALSLVLPRGARLSGKLTGAAIPTGAYVVALEVDRLRERQSGWLFDLMRFGKVDPCGIYAIDALAATRHSVDLVLPQDHGRGGGVAVPLGNVDVGRVDLTKDVELASGPVILRGKVELVGTPLPHTRLAIVAWTPASRDRAERPEPYAVASVAADGSYEMRIRPRSCVEVVDTWTRVVLQRQLTPAGNPDQTLDLQLRVALGKVAVTLVPATPGQPVVLRMLEADVRHPTPSPRDTVITNLPVNTQCGVAVARGTSQVEMILPAVPAELEAWSGADYVFTEGTTMKLPRPLVTSSVEVKAGETTRVTLTVPGK